MNRNQISHKCGYCGFLFHLSTNFLEHDCFQDFVEDEDRIYIDENNVVTMIYGKETEQGSACKYSLDELLIEAVKARKGLYDYRIPVFERTNLRKNALWTEVSSTLGGALSAKEAKNRWKYLRDNYAKARKKIKNYVPSASAAKPASEQKKSKFRFYDVMTFLNDILETWQTVSSLPDTEESEAYVTPEQHDETVASSSRCTYMYLHVPTYTNMYMYQHPRTPTFFHTSPPMLTPTRRSPQRILSSTSVFPQTFHDVPSGTPPALSTTSRVPAINARRRLQTTDEPGENPAVKKPKSDADALQTALIEALKEPTEESDDPSLDGFLARLRGGMRTLPKPARSRLEICFLTLLMEEENNHEIENAHGFT